MTLAKRTVPVVAAPMFEAGNGRSTLELEPGLSLAEIVVRALPAHALFAGRVRVALVSEKGSAIIPAENWTRVYPHAGTTVVIRVVPGKDALRSLLSVVVSIAAVALGQYWALGLSQTLGISQGLARGLISLGVSALGNLLINALIPPAKPDDERKNGYTISGWRNRLNQDGAVPVPMGEIRFAPPFATLPVSDIIGDDQYITASFMIGYGRVVTEDYRIGETSLGEYKGVQIEVREGVAGEAPLSLISRQRVPALVGAKLTRPKPRDALGEIIAGPTIETPIVRNVGKDASGASIILGWPAGLFSVDKKGKMRSQTVSIKIQQRLVQAEEWQDVITLDITARKKEGFYRQHTWDFPSRGNWQVRCINLTDENTSMQVSNDTSWVELQTIRPEYPLNYPMPVAVIALRVKATHQLNGQLDDFNCIARRHCLDYDHATDSWIERATRNPAAFFRFLHQGAPSARPVSDAGLDFDNLKDWHDFCRLKDLKYDRVVDDASGSLREVRAEIAAAGRAAPRHDGRQWGVVIDRPAALPVIDEFSPRNAYGFEVVRNHFRPPHGVRVPFLDQTNDNKPTERLIPWHNHVGDITETERWELPGKTDPMEVYRETMRRMFEATYRPDTWRLSLDNPVTAATRGDKVRVSLNTIERTQVTARVKSAKENLVELDELVTMEADKDYAIRFRVGITAEDTLGTSVVRTVVRQVGETSVLVLSGTGSTPIVGSFALFGEAGAESAALIVLDAEAGEKLSSHLRLTDAAPIIDELTDALEIPAWSGRIGAEIPANLLQPPEPRFTSITSGVSGAENANLVTYLIEPGSGPIIAVAFEISHRLAGAPGWTTFTIPAANGGGSIDIYVLGNAIELQARALSAAGVPGPATPIIPLTIGAGDLAIPVALDSGAITVGALLGGAVVQFPSGDDINTTQVQLYHSTSPVLNRATDAVGAPTPVQPGRGYSLPVGDTTRANLLTGTWVLGAGWSIVADKATKTAGMASMISMALPLAAGKYYRVAFPLSDVTAGTITPRLTGTTNRNGTGRAANGAYSDRIQAVTGNNTFGFLGDLAFTGSVDLVDLVVFLETATCLTAGTHYYWLEPQNDDDVPGPVAGPFSVVIR